MTDEHARIEELLSAMQDGAASPDEVALVERHLATCARCRATAASFQQVDRQVRRYLMGTPVPELAAPWRNEPLVAAAPRRAGGLGHWRITTVGLALIFALLFAGTALTFFTRDAGQPREAQTGAALASAAAQVVAPTQTIATSAAFGAAPSAPASTAASASARSAASAAASAAPAAAPPAVASSSAAASAAGSAAASSSGSGNATGAVVTTPAPRAAGTPAASAPAPQATATVASINPVQAFGLQGATSLTLCRPECAAQSQPADLVRRVIAALDRPLSPAAAAPSAVSPDQYVTLRFTLADGRVVDIGYYIQSGTLQLPSGRGLAVAPAEFVAALAEALAPR